MEELLSQLTTGNTVSGLGDFSELAYNMTYFVLIAALSFIITSISYRVSLKYFDREMSVDDLFIDKTFLKIIFLCPLVISIIALFLDLYLIDLCEVKKDLSNINLLITFFLTFFYFFFCEITTFYTYKFIFNIGGYEFNTLSAKMVNFMVYTFLTSIYLSLISFTMFL